MLIEKQIALLAELNKTLEVTSVDHDYQVDAARREAAKAIETLCKVISKAVESNDAPLVVLPKKLTPITPKKDEDVPF